MVVKILDKILVVSLDVLLLYLSSQRASLYGFRAIDFNVLDIQYLLCPISISFGIDLLCHAYWLVSLPFPSCSLPFAQKRTGNKLQVRDILHEDPDNPAKGSKLLCR